MTLSCTPVINTNAYSLDVFIITHAVCFSKTTLRYPVTSLMKLLILSFNSFSEHVKMEVCYDDPCKAIIEGEIKKVEIIYEGTMKGHIY